jgi:hypothetical protein
MPSPYVLEAARRAQIQSRRDLMVEQMRAEGTPEPVIERLATDDTAAKMLEYDRKVTDMILSLFGPR